MTTLQNLTSMFSSLAFIVAAEDISGLESIIIIESTNQVLTDYQENSSGLGLYRGRHKV